MPPDFRAQNGTAQYVKLSLPPPPFYVHSMSGFGMNRNQAFGMNNSLSSNIFNGTGKYALNLKTSERWSKTPFYIYI